MVCSHYRLPPQPQEKGEEDLSKYSAHNLIGYVQWYEQEIIRMQAEIMRIKKELAERGTAIGGGPLVELPPAPTMI